MLGTDIDVFMHIILKIKDGIDVEKINRLRDILKESSNNIEEFNIIEYIKIAGHDTTHKITSKYINIKDLFSNKDINNETLRLYKKGYNDLYISRKLNKKFNLNLSYNHITRWRKLRNLAANKTYIADISCTIDEKEDDILKLINNGWSVRKISEKYGFSESQLYLWKSKRGLCNDNRSTEKEMYLRFKMYDEGKTDKEIADKFGIKIKSVEQWRSNHGLKKK